MAISLVTILSAALKEQGDNLTSAKKDAKTIKRNISGIRASRKLIANGLRDLKKDRLEADCAGGGKKSAKITSEINFLRQVLKELSEELVMNKLHNKECGKYLKQQHEYVVSIDSEWEKAKAAEPVVETEVSETANETDQA